MKITLASLTTSLDIDTNGLVYGLISMVIEIKKNQFKLKFGCFFSILVRVKQDYQGL